MANDDVLIVGKLDDNALKSSIDALVKYVGDKTNAMAESFTQGLDKMKLAMKDFAVTQQVSVTLMQEAWRKMSTSFDAMMAAQSAYTSGGGNNNSGSSSSADPDSVKALKNEISAAEKVRDTLHQWSPELESANKHIEEMRNNLNKMLAKGTIKQEMANARKELGDATTLPTRSLSEAQRKLAVLENIQNKYKNSTLLSVQQTNRLATAIDNCKKKIDKLTQSKPTTLKDVLGMDENSFDAISKKMSALKKLSWANNGEKGTIVSEYQRLREEQNKLLSNNARMIRSNNYLAQSFGYIRNRIVYALTLGAMTSFIKQIYEIRGQYELLERSLGILTDNMRRGSEIFNELNAMALKSPFTLTELATGAKQLIAYNFAEDEVVETTRRLADISSALGVPMERLVYNLGQIRAQTVLNARDARDFANAGLAIVPMLAQLYTEEKRFGDELVTTSQVYDMMSKKMVSYSDVMKVINKITDEGGKFYNFQAKQAETMIVQMNNLKLAWNNMLNDIGKDNQSALSAPLKGLKYLFENWRSLEKVIRGVIVALGLYYARAKIVALINGTLITQGTIRAGYLLAKSWYAAKDAWVALRTVMMTNPFGLLAVGIASVIGYMALFNDSVDTMTEYSNRFGESGGKVVRDVESLYAALGSIDKESSTYKKVLGELNQILGDYNLEQIKETDNINEVIRSRDKNIQLIKQEIIERQHLNELEEGKNQYEDKIKDIQQKLKSNLENAITENFFGIGTVNKEIAKNAPALSRIISDIIEEDIELVANKTGKEYEEGVDKIFAKIQERLKNNKALGLSDDVLESSWLENNFFRFWKSNIIKNVINDIKDAKEANDSYNESINENYEQQKKAASSAVSFNDKVQQTQNELLKAENDTDKFHKKIETLLKDYGGQNVIDFMVKIKTDVPAWMSKKGLSELNFLAARFTALATNAEKGGKKLVDFGNGVKMTQQQLFERAALYRQAAANKAADIEAKKSTTITREASEALKEYKTALNAADIAKNRFNRGVKGFDQSVVTQKEAEAQKAYNKALEKGVSLKELQDAKNGKGKKGGSKKDVLGDALTKEIQLISDIQKLYKDYQKAGVDADTARIASAKEYEKTLKSVNATLAKFGIKGLGGETLATMDARGLRDFYKQMLNIANLKGNTKGVEALEKAIRSLNSEITKVDYKIVVDSLNNKLGKLSEDYELAIELNATPELGDIFSSIFSIDKSSLPKDIYDYIGKMQDYAYVAIANAAKLSPNMVMKPFDLLRDDIKIWAKETGVDVESDLAKGLVEGQKKAKGAVKKYVDDTYKQTKDLEYKLADTNGKIAIEQKKLADLERELSKETHEEKKHLLELQIKEQEETIAKLKESILSEIPAYKALFNSVVEHSDMVTRKLAKNYINILEQAKRNGKNDKGEFTVTQNGITAPISEERLNKELKAANKELRKSESSFNKISKAFQKAEDGTIDWAKGVELVGQELQNLSSLTDSISSIASLFTNPNEYSETAEILADISSTFSGMSDMATGIAKIASGDYIAGAASVLSGVATTIGAWMDNSDKKISAQVKESERAVKRLENEYKKLQQAVDDAYGVAEIGAKRAAIANKELQLLELKRSLQLEESRKGKKRDEDKIEDLKGQIIDLELEIKNATREIVGDLTGITSVGDAAESMVLQMIEAFKQGEDYMGKFSDTFDDMIDNMIMKAIVSKVVGEKMQEIFNRIQDIANKRADQTMVNVKDIFDDTGSQWVRGWIEHGMYFSSTNQTIEEWRKGLEQVLARNMPEEGRKVYSDAFEKLNKLYSDNVTITPSDVSSVKQEATEMKDDAKKTFDAYMEAFGILFGQDSTKELSALQQGIQGITEDTAGALEAYMNGVSQQVYLHSQLLTEIRDAVVGFNFDVQVGTMAEMLLQLQQSYQVQMSIESILRGVLNPSEQAIKVELLS